VTLTATPCEQQSFSVNCLTLRDYQQDLIDRTRAALREHRRVLTQAPTGAGKTVLASYMAGGAGARGVPTFFMCHRAELVRGTAATFGRWGIGHGIVAAGHPIDLGHAVQVCSIDTVRHRVARLPTPGLVIWDEAHHIAAASWGGLMSAWPDARHVGLSATPWRSDGTGLGDFFDDLVLGPSTADLIARGALSPFVVYAPDIPDMKGVRRQGGDYAAGGAAQVMQRPKIVGDIVAHWRHRAAGLRTVGFACTVAHSRAMVDAFLAAGIPAAHLDGDTPAADRARIVQAFADGDVLVLWNVSLFGEGFDLSAVAGRDVTIDAVIQARPTQSLALHLQQVGRALRPAAGKRAVILDHAGNAHRHGLPDDPREWSLVGGLKRQAANDGGPPPPVTCSGCFGQIRRPLPDACPYCAHPLEAQRAQDIKAAEGQLVEIDAARRKALEAQRAKEKRRLELAEQAAAKTLGELIALAQRRGYRNPTIWATKTWGGRAAKARR
jgi:DNA repair protein RadD